MYSLILPCVVALTASAALTAGVRRVALRCSVVDHPDGQRKLHPASTPLWGGIGIFLALLLAVAAAGQDALGAQAGPFALIVATLVVAGFFCVLGAVDDYHNLPSRRKLLLQVIALLPLVALGYHFDHVSLLNRSVALGWLGYPITMAWLIACINAFNLLDGSDALAATVGLLASVVVAVVALAMGHGGVAVMAAALAGATAGFLVHNRPPARIFLGDSGSMVIGLVVGILSAEAAMTPKGDLVVAFPLVLMCLPLLDSLLALGRRKLTGRPFDAPDREHIHHRLSERGMGPWQVLATITGLFAVTGAAATAAILSGHKALGWTAALTLVVWLVRARWFGHHEWELGCGVLRRWGHRLEGRVKTRLVGQLRLGKPSRDDICSPSRNHRSNETVTGTKRSGVLEDKGSGPVLCFVPGTPKPGSGRGSKNEEGSSQRKAA